MSRFASGDNEEKEFHQRVADQSIQSIEDRQDEIKRAKNGFIGMLAGIVVGGIVGWIFLGPADNIQQNHEIPLIRRPLTPAKVLPNEPGGMEIDNQDRGIYHIVEKKPKSIEPVNIRSAPDMPKLEINSNLSSSEAMENLVASIDNDKSLDADNIEIDKKQTEKIKLASKKLEPVKTNSAEKVTIPQKIEDIDIQPQKTIKSETQTKATKSTLSINEKAEKNIADKGQEQHPPFTKGTWYAQIIASSSRDSVQRLWNNLTSKHTFLKDYPHEIEEIKTAKGTLYRLKVGTFKTRDQATALGNKLKQKQISSIIKQN